MQILSKDIIRKHMLAKRKALDVIYMQSAAGALVEKLLSYIPNNSSIIAGYSPIRNEMDVRPAMIALVNRGHALCLPVISDEPSPHLKEGRVRGDGGLQFHHWHPDDPLVLGSYGIEIPTKGQAATPDMVLVPLVAFDAQGNRLGYGAGYYDRTINTLRHVKKHVKIIGIAYSLQQIDHIAAEPHDEQLDMVITESGIIHIK